MLMAWAMLFPSVKISKLWLCQSIHELSIQPWVEYKFDKHNLYVYIRVNDKNRPRANKYPHHNTENSF